MNEALRALIEAAAALRDQWMREPLSSDSGQMAALRVVQAYDAYMEESSA